MFSVILDSNLDRIRSDLRSRGLSYDPLLDDMLDHICCMVEEKMEQGKDFDSSYGTVLSSLEENSLSRIQHQTFLNLDLKYQRMKNFTYIFGLISAIITILGSFFKMMHWPGASILITVGIFLVAAVFLPMYFITMNREQEEKKNPIYSIVGYLTIALLLAGALFKIMHWPGAYVMLQVGTAFLIVGFIPLYVVNIFQRTESKRVILPYVTMVLVGIAIVMLISGVRMGKYLVDIYEDEAMANEVRIETSQDRTALLIEGMSDSVGEATISKVLHIHEEALLIQTKILSMQDGMKDYLNQPGAPLEQIKGKDNKQVGRAAILDTGKGVEFMQTSIKFHELLKGYVDDPMVLNQIEDHLEFTSKYWPYEFGADHVRSQSFMKIYYKNTDVSKGVALAEYVAIDYLLKH